jgi:hypothetical protein
MSPISTQCQNTGGSADEVSDDDDEEEVSAEEDEDDDGAGGWPSRKLLPRRASKTGERAMRMTLDA